MAKDMGGLIASTHRVYSIAEKSAMGDGRVDSTKLLAHGEQAAKRFIRFDMARAAEEAGSVISAVLFGALAGSGVLPFSRAQFEATIERGGVGVKPSLRAFAGAFDRAQSGDAPAAVEAAPAQVAVPAPRDPAVRALVERVQQTFPAHAQLLLLEGVRRLIDYQDLAYAETYLDRMQAIAALPANDGGRLLEEVARHLALWMSYEDTARVAALKTRSTRFERVRGEAGVQADQLMAIEEYMHPRLQEICETLPGGLGRWLMNSGAPRRLVERMTKKGRVVRTSSLRGYLMLRGVAAAKGWRRSTTRFAEENRHIEQWLARIAETVAFNPALALEIAQCQRLVKGYSDTHERGLRNYLLLMEAALRAGQAMAPATLRELRDAALADEHGKQLRAKLAQYALG